MGKLVGYDYEITYKPGSCNAAADALSRRSDSPRLDSISVQKKAIWDELRQMATSDPYLLKLAQLASHTRSATALSVITTGSLYRRAQYSSPHCYMNITTLCPGVIQVFFTLLSGCLLFFIGRQCIGQCVNMLPLVTCVNELNMTAFLLRDCFNHCLFPNVFGRMC